MRCHRPRYISADPSQVPGPRCGVAQQESISTLKVCDATMCGFRSVFLAAVREKSQKMMGLGFISKPRATTQIMVALVIALSQSTGVEFWREFG